MCEANVVCLSLVKNTLVSVIGSYGTQKVKSNHWCLLIREGVFRLHTGPLESVAAGMVGTGQTASPDCRRREMEGLRRVSFASGGLSLAKCQVHISRPALKE